MTGPMMALPVLFVQNALAAGLTGVSWIILAFLGVYTRLGTSSFEKVPKSLRSGL